MEKEITIVEVVRWKGIVGKDGRLWTLLRLNDNGSTVTAGHVDGSKLEVEKSIVDGVAKYDVWHKV